MQTHITLFCAFSLANSSSTDDGSMVGVLEIARDFSSMILNHDSLQIVPNNPEHLHTFPLNSHFMKVPDHSGSVHSPSSGSEDLPVHVKHSHQYQTINGVTFINHTTTRTCRVQCLLRAVITVTLFFVHNLLR